MNEQRFSCEGKVYEVITSRGTQSTRLSPELPALYKEITTPREADDV